MDNTRFIQPEPGFLFQYDSLGFFAVDFDRHGGVQFDMLQVGCFSIGRLGLQPLPIDKAVVIVGCGEIADSQRGDVVKKV